MAAKPEGHRSDMNPPDKGRRLSVGAPTWTFWLISFLPTEISISYAERLRSCIGAALGILLTGLLSALALGPAAATPWLIAPMGASAVLLFAVPASPLAQPWSITGGNLVAALMGVTCAKLIGAPVPAAAVFPMPRPSSVPCST